MKMIKYYKCIYIKILTLKQLKNLSLGLLMVVFLINCETPENKKDDKENSNKTKEKSELQDLSVGNAKELSPKEAKDLLNKYKKSKIKNKDKYSDELLKLLQNKANELDNKEKDKNEIEEKQNVQINDKTNKIRLIPEKNKSNSEDKNKQSKEGDGITQAENSNNENNQPIEGDGITKAENSNNENNQPKEREGITKAENSNNENNQPIEGEGITKAENSGDIKIIKKGGDDNTDNTNNVTSVNSKNSNKNQYNGKGDKSKNEEIDKADIVKPISTIGKDKNNEQVSDGNTKNDKDQKIFNELNIEKNINVNLQFIRFMNNNKIKEAYKLLKHSKIDFDFIEPENKRDMLYYALYIIHSASNRDLIEYKVKILNAILKKKKVIDPKFNYKIKYDKIYDINLLETICQYSLYKSFKIILKKCKINVDIIFEYQNEKGNMLYFCFRYLDGEKKKIEMIKFLLDKGASYKTEFDIKLGDHFYKFSLLHILMINGKEKYLYKKDIIDYMKSKCKDFNINHKGSSNYTPLGLASILTNVDLPFIDYLATKLGAKRNV